jgi:hypothetical protein
MKQHTQTDVMKFAKTIPNLNEPGWGIMRFIEAYLMMAMRAKYRPGAPGDGCGGIYLSDAELADPNRLRQEAVKYAKRFKAEEDTRNFNVGCSNYDTNRAFMFAIDAARNLAAGQGGNATALRLLKLAIEETEIAELEWKATH